MRITRPLSIALGLIAALMATILSAAPANAADPTTRDAAPGLNVQQPGSLMVALTDEQASRAGISPSRTTDLALPTGGHILVTPAATPAGMMRPSFHAHRAWYALKVYFNKVETLKISIGYGACALIVGRVPLVGEVLAAYCTAVSMYAGYLLARGRCLRATVIWGSVAPAWGGYRGRWCR
jgi:hypothetical protein